MIGQDAVATAKTFNDWLNYDGVVLTKLDGDARGGAALSVKAVTGKPVKFVGMGESAERLEEFRPDGMASRILGRGDVVGLIQQFEEVVDEEKAEQDAVRMLKGKFDMNDFLEQIGVLQKMGSLSDLVEKIPGVSDAMPEGAKIDDRELVKIKAIISSMTDDERRHPERFVVTSWEEVVEGGTRRKKRSAFYEQGRMRRVAARLRPQGERGRRPAEPLRDDAAADDADRGLQRPAGQDPRLQAVGPDEEVRRRRREPAGQHDEHALGRARRLPGAQAQRRQGQGKAEAQGRPQGPQEVAQATLSNTTYVARKRR